uniref:Ig-like domain-containing protein n=1 Tax=Monodelphis domestica TaxID=13616 RepID=F7EHL7_MONDO
MTPALSVLLCLGGSPGPNSSPSLPDGLPKPSLRAENGSLVPQGRNVTLRCRGSWEAEEWRLEKKRGYGWSESKTVRQAGNEGEFSLLSVTSNDAGTYRCLYRHSSYGWAEPSDPLELVVTGLSAPPSLAALPGSEVEEGQNVTLQCRSEGWYDSCVLYKDGEEISRSTQSHGRRCQIDFSLPSVTSHDAGTYRCLYRHSSSWWSQLSDPLELLPPWGQIGDRRALPSSAVVSGQNVTLQCWSELYYGWFALCKDREEISGGRTRSHGRMYQADFFFPAVTLTNNGSYGCFGYHSSSPSLWSSPSAPLVLWVSGEAAPAPSQSLPATPTPPSSLRLPLYPGVPPCLLRPIAGESSNSDVPPTQ